METGHETAKGMNGTDYLDTLEQWSKLDGHEAVFHAQAMKLGGRFTDKEIKRVKGFYNRENVFKQLKTAVSFLIPHRSDVKLILNIGGGSFTDGKSITVGLPEMFVRSSYEEIFTALRALVGHEAQHVNSSDFKAYVAYQEEMVNYFLKTYKKFNPNYLRSYVSKTSVTFGNGTEDGRIEKILGTNLPGYIKYLQFLNGSIWNAQPMKGNTELGDFLQSIVSVAVTGLNPKDFNHFYKGTDLESNIKKVKPMILHGINATTANQCLNVCREMIHEVEDYLIYLFENQSREDEEFMNNLPDQPEYTTSEESEYNTDSSTTVHFTKPKPQKKDKKEEDKQEEEKQQSSKGEAGEEEQEEKASDEENKESSSSSKSKKSSKEETEEEEEEQENGSGSSSEESEKDEEKEGNSEGSSDEQSDEEEGDEQEGNSGSNSDKDEEEGDEGAEESSNDDSEGNSSDSDSDESDSDSSDGDSSDGDNEDSSDSDSDSSDSQDSEPEKNDTDSESSSSMPEGMPQSDEEGETGEDEEEENDLTEEEIAEQLMEIKNSVEQEARDKIGEKKEEVKKKKEKEEDYSLSPDELAEVEQQYKRENYKGFQEIKNLPLRYDMPVELKRESSHFKKEIEKIVRNKEAYTLRGQKRGLLDTQNLHRVGAKDFNVFVKRGVPVKTDYVFFLLEDGSGSMRDEKKEFHSKYALAIMEEGLKGVVPFKSATFNVDWNKNVVTHHVIKDFNENNRKYNYAYNALNHRRASSGNKDGYSIRVATKELLKRPEKDKVLIVFSDGLPSDYNGGQKEGMVDVKNAVKEARQAGIMVVSIAFGTPDFRDYNMENYRYMYEKNIISCEPKQITSQMTRMLKKVLSR